MVLFYSRKDVRQTLMAYFNSYTIQNSSIASLYCRFKYRLIKQEREHCTFHFFYFNNNFLQVLKRKYIKHGETLLRKICFPRMEQFADTPHNAGMYQLLTHTHARMHAHTHTNTHTLKIIVPNYTSDICHNH